MIKLKTTIPDEAFNQKRTHQYKLSILIGVDSFSYLVLDNTNRAVLLKEYITAAANAYSKLPAEQIHELFKQDRLLKLSYAEVKVAFANRKQIFIPNRLYNPEKKSVYLEHAADITVSDHIQSNDITALRSQNVFGADRATLNFLEQMYSKIKSYHIHAALYVGFLAQTDYEKSTLFLNIRDKNVQLFFFQGKELIFSNAFPFKTEKDLTYFVMLIFDQFNLSPQEQVIRVAGDFKESGVYHEALSKHVQYIYPVQVPSNIKFEELTKKRMDNHHYFDLMSIQLCD